MENTIICELSKNENFHMNFKQILGLIGMRKKHYQNELVKLLKELEETQQIYQNSDGFYVNFPSNFFVTEIIPKENDKNYIFINDKYYPIGKLYLNGAMNFDKVVVKNENGSFVVTKILERKLDEIVCEVKQDITGKLYLDPFEIDKIINLHIGHNVIKKMHVGDRVVVKLSTEKHNDYYVATILKKLGTTNDPQINLICHNFIENNHNIEKLNDINKKRYQKLLLNRKRKILEIEKSNNQKGKTYEAQLVGLGSFYLKIKLPDGTIGTILFNDVLTDALHAYQTCHGVFSSISFEEYLIGHKLLVRYKEKLYDDDNIYFELIKNKSIEEETVQRKLVNVKHN